MTDKGQQRDSRTPKTQHGGTSFDSFVLEKDIFSNIFEKDIKRIYIYKKVERLAKAIHLIAPAFRGTAPLHERVLEVSVTLVDAATLPPSEARDALSRELLALSSVLSIARSAGILSPMNADLIGKEAHLLLEEIAGYEEPRISLPESLSLAELSRDAAPALAAPRSVRAAEPVREPMRSTEKASLDKGQSKGRVSDRILAPRKDGRRESILSVLRAKGPSYIKDLSTVIRDVSEKTIQRELQVLVQEGTVTRSGERRWTTYALAEA